MFTGIIEEIGEIKSISKGSDSSNITIKANTVLEDVKLGDSIAVNGVCLTVTKFNFNEFTVDIMAETLRKSSLYNASIGDKVNLERAIALGERLGGHIVSGHIDCRGEITNIVNEDIATWLTIKPLDKFMKYIILKGSIAVDGVSLTVAKVGDDCFKVSLIPHTKGITTLYNKKIGEFVNLEFDIIGKYIERLFNFKNEEDTKYDKSDISIDLLKKSGFI